MLHWLANAVSWRDNSSISLLSFIVGVGGFYASLLLLDLPEFLVLLDKLGIGLSDLSLKK